MCTLKPRISFLGAGILASGLSIADISNQTQRLDNLDAYGELVYLQTRGYPAIYGVVISGLQPYNPSWSEKIVDMNYAPGFDIGIAYHTLKTPEAIALSWMHLDVTQKSTTNVPTFLTTYPNGETNYYTIAPVYDMGPGIFSIKSATGSNQLNFDKISLDVDKIYRTTQTLFGASLHTDFKAGLDFVRISQSLTSTYFNNVGFPPTSLSYPVRADPGYKFVDKTTSKYWGVGPKLGIDAAYGLYQNFELISQSTFSLTCGGISAADHFQGYSSLNPNVGAQSLSIPNEVTIVPGFETKLGIGYHYHQLQKHQLSVEAGYRIASYLNALWTVRPSTLVYPGTTFAPEVATGNMNIRTSSYDKNNFTWNGPYLRILLKS